MQQQKSFKKDCDAWKNERQFLKKANRRQGSKMLLLMT